MLDREEVEKMLAETRVHTGRRAAIVAELCRTWLAVQDAPGAYVNGVYASELAERVGEITSYLPPELIGQRVRLVRDGDSGEE